MNPFRSQSPAIEKQMKLQGYNCRIPILITKIKQNANTQLFTQQPQAKNQDTKEFFTALKQNNNTYYIKNIFYGKAKMQLYIVNNKIYEQLSQKEAKKIKKEILKDVDELAKIKKELCKLKYKFKCKKDLAKKNHQKQRYNYYKNTDYKKYYEKEYQELHNLETKITNNIDTLLNKYEETLNTLKFKNTQEVDIKNMIKENTGILKQKKMKFNVLFNSIVGNKLNFLERYDKEITFEIKCKDGKSLFVIKEASTNSTNKKAKWKLFDSKTGECSKYKKHPDITIIGKKLQVNLPNGQKIIGTIDEGGIFNECNVSEKSNKDQHNKKKLKSNDVNFLCKDIGKYTFGRKKLERA